MTIRLLSVRGESTETTTGNVMPTDGWAAPAPGQLEIVWFVTPTGNTVSAPAGEGWSARITGAVADRVTMFWRHVTDANAARSSPFTHNLGPTWYAWEQAIIDGHHPSAPLNVTPAVGGSSTAGTAVTAPSVDTTVTHGLLLCLFATGQQSGGNTITLPSPLAGGASHTRANPGGYTTRLGAVRRVGAGASTARTATAAVAASTLSMTVYVEPARNRVAPVVSTATGGSSGSATSTSYTVPVAALAPAPGDTIVAYLHLNSTATVTSVPAGWSVAYDQSFTGDARLAILVKRFAAGDSTADVTVGFTSSPLTRSVFKVLGADPDSVGDVPVVANAAAASGTSVAVTPPGTVSDNALVVFWVAGTFTAGASTADITAPAGLVSAPVRRPSSDPTGVVLRQAHGTRPTPGSGPAQTFTLSSSVPTRAAVMAVRGAEAAEQTISPAGRAAATQIGTPRVEAPVVRTYAASAAIIPNPERGWFNYTDTHLYPDGSGHVPLVESALVSARTTAAQTLVFRYYYIEKYRTVDTVDASYLGLLAADFATARAAGVKLMPRFAYSGAGNISAPPYNCDTTPARTMGHVTQFAATLNAHADILDMLHLGFIGMWGEWYYTDHWGDLGVLSAQNKTDRVAFVNHMIDSIDARVYLGLRYPGFKREVFPG